MKREGQRQEDKGKLKGKIDSTIGKTQDALKGLKEQGRPKLNNRPNSGKPPASLP